MSHVEKEDFKPLDPNLRFVRITGIRNNRLIEFDFLIGEPEMYVKLGAVDVHLNSIMAAASEMKALKL